MKSIFVALALCVLSATYGMAWSGYDYQNGTYVDIDKGNLVRPGTTIDIYDYSSGYKSVDVESVRSTGLGTVEVEVYDYDSGEHRTIEMDK